MSLSIDLIQWTDKLRIRSQGEKRQVFDPVRRKYVAFTPEELVRQLMLCYLLEDLTVSRGRIAVERKITSVQMDKRFDILLFDRQAAPWMIIECKSSGMKLDQQVIDQAGIYNATLRAPFLCVSNGKETRLFALDFERKEFEELYDFPTIL